jgi:hypothetical protein
MKHGLTSGAMSTVKTAGYGTLKTLSFHKKPLHSLRVGVWCAVSWQTVVAPFFFSQKTVTAKVYQKINEQLITLLEDDWYCWLQ